MVEVNSSELYDRNKKQVTNGPLDLQHGPTEKGPLCETCGKGILECPGHYGHVQLAQPVFHAGFFKHTYQLAQCLCKSCGRLLI